MGEKAASSLEALEKANKYSSDTGGVGILISYGNKNGSPVTELGDAFVNALKSKQIESRYYYYNTDRDGAAMEFYVGHSAFGPWSVQDAAKRLKEVVARSEALKNIQKLSDN